jgi:hypothetical protein
MAATEGMAKAMEGTVATKDMTPRVPRTVAVVTEGTMMRWNMNPDMMMDMIPRGRRMVVAASMVAAMVDTELYELLPFKPKEEVFPSSFVS